MVGVLVRCRWKGGKKGEKMRKKFGNRSYTIPKQHEGRKYDMYTYLIPTSYKYICTEIQIYERYPPSFLLPPKYHIIAFNIHITARSYNTYLHLVSSIMIIPYNNTDKLQVGTLYPHSKFHKHKQAPRRLASYSLPHLHLSDNKYKSNTKYAYTHIHK